MEVLIQEIPISLFYLKLILFFCICPVVCSCVLVKYLNAFHVIDINNKMHYYDPSVDKYWLTQSGYFRLANKMVLGVGIKDTKLLFCHGISEINKYKKIAMQD